MQVLINVDRETLTDRDLRLNFELRQQFCSAVTHAIKPLAEMARACHNLGPNDIKNPDNLHDRFKLYVTPPMQDVLAGAVYQAVRSECSRTGFEYPKEINDNAKVENLAMSALQYTSGCTAVLLAPKNWVQNWVQPSAP